MVIGLGHCLCWFVFEAVGPKCKVKFRDESAVTESNVENANWEEFLEKNCPRLCSTKY